MTSLILSVHDVAPATITESKWWVEILEDLGLRATLLVVPGPWHGHDMASDAEFRDWLGDCADTGHEIALHGWSHTQQAEEPKWARVMARGAAEFAGLSHQDTLSRLSWGLESLGSVGVEKPGFTPPGWILTTASAEAARVADLDYITTHLGVEDLRTGVTHRVPVVCHRPDSRLRKVGAAVVRQGARMSYLLGKTVRLAIHPADTHDPDLVSETLNALRSSREKGVPVQRYSDFLAALR